MYYIITYNEDSYYQAAKEQLLDPEMGLDCTDLSIYFTDITNEIEIFDHYDNVKKIDFTGKIFSIEFINGNVFEDYVDRAEIELRSDYNRR